MAKEAEKKEAEIKEEISTEEPKIKSARKRGKKRTLTEGVFYINANLNNTIVTLADKAGNVVAVVSTGQVGFKGSRKATPFAASKAAQLILDKARNAGMTTADVVVKGIGIGRDSVLRTLGSSDIYIKALRDVTPVPHNGPRAKRSRRV
jgi:small subunit ribosomal protein S11